MKNSNIQETGLLQSLALVAGLIAVLSIGACGDSGTGGEQQSQSAAPETTESMTADTPVTGTPMPDEDPAKMAEEAMATSSTMEETAPAPQPTESTAEATKVAAEPEVNGREVYYTYCAVCHKSGLNAAPKYGNKALWAKRIEQGREVMYKHAIEGLRGMPPRGGIPGLSDAQVKAATDFMVRGSGGWGDS